MIWNLVAERPPTGSCTHRIIRRWAAALPAVHLSFVPQLCLLAYDSQLVHVNQEDIQVFTVNDMEILESFLKNVRPWLVSLPSYNFQH